MTILLATLLATSAVAHLIHFLVFRNKFFLVRQSFIDEIDRLRRSLNTTKTNNLKEVSSAYKSLESKDQEIQSLKDALRTRAENELKRISESSKEIDRLKAETGCLEIEAEYKTLEAEYKTLEAEYKTLESVYSKTLFELEKQKALNNDLKLKAICASDLYNVELEKHKATIETFQNNFASYKAEKEAKIDKLNEELTAAKVRYENIYGMLRNGAKETELTLQRKIDSLRTKLNDVVKHKDKKIRALESECLECQRSLERLTSQGNQKTALIEDLRTQINRQAERFNLHASDALKGIDLEAKDKEIERLTELVGSYKLVSDEVSKADTDRRNKVNSLINYTSMGGLTKTETIAKLQALI